ncbi:ABC transporter permease [Bianquea renquensis]|jgi:ABC transporter, permease protein|uniref:Sugar ABC transporter permease n=1 Tax=Bianquea renquensis TaxID=2763661 RepID=A0A926DUB4_9FIRM|nr:ABC transporter permease subunit [Bianquea renquensis]MBC8544831.1 sugar ABC transporter permease [Bianquea renquensis]
MNHSVRVAKVPRTPHKSLRAKHSKVWQLYVLCALPVLLLLVFSYIPMVGNLIAFQDYSVRRGLASEFVGFKYFRQFFEMPIFWQIMKNTVLLSVYSIVIGFPFPILLALAFNELSHARTKKILQTVTYAPYFISTVVLVSIMMQVLHYRYGIVNSVIKSFGGQPIDFLSKKEAFRPMYVLSGIWQGAGYSSVLYFAALSGVDASLYEAATIDGATKLKRVIHIDIPCILPTIVITLILNTGSILSVGFEKVFLLQNASNYAVSEIISTYVYKIGVKDAQFSLSTAIGLFNAVVNFIILFIVNKIASKISDISLF